MNFTKNFILVAAAVLVIFNRQSDAGIVDFFTQGAHIVQAIGSATADIVTDGVSAAVETLGNQLTDAVLYKDAIKAILAVKRKADETRAVSENNEAIDTVTKGLIDTINGVASAIKAGYDGLRIARDAKTVSSDVAIEDVEEAFTKAKRRIGLAGSSAYLAYGATTQICEKGATRGLNDATQIMTNAGIVAYNGLDATKSLVIQGIQAGSNATDQSFTASFRGLKSTAQATFNIVVMSGDKAFQAIKDESNLIVDNSEFYLLREEAVAKSPKCQGAIERINQLAEQATKTLLPGPKLEAIKVAKDGLVNACKTIAGAGQPGYMAMEGAKEIPEQQSALALVTKGIDGAKKESIAAVAYGHQAIGGASYIVQQAKEGLAKAITVMEIARGLLTKGLDNALLLAVQGIKSNAAESGLTAGHDALATAGFSGYAQIVKCANVAFNAIMSA